MLPKQVIDLIEGCARAFEGEFPAKGQYGKGLSAVHLKQMRTRLGWGSADIKMLGNDVTAHLQRKAEFLWEKAQLAVTATDPEFYASLNDDLKSCIAGFLNPDMQAAEYFLDEIQRESH